MVESSQFMLVGGKILETGNFNHTKSAEQDNCGEHAGRAPQLQGR
jgi:hypothetical protein